MKAVGVITEYNPLHSGHILHINMSKSMSASDVVVCVMSGDYVQRGEPAIIDKFSRARMALESGVDLVVELLASSLDIVFQILVEMLVELILQSFL